MPVIIAIHSTFSQRQSDEPWKVEEFSWNAVAVWGSWAVRPTCLRQRRKRLEMSLKGTASDTA